ncbi:MAG: hypothetical protein AAF211_33440, partial [Myxococcota bacterium]
MAKAQSVWVSSRRRACSTSAAGRAGRGPRSGTGTCIPPDVGSDGSGVVDDDTPRAARVASRATARCIA